MPTSDSPAPRGSSGVAASSRERGLKMAIATAAMATTGRLARNTEPHQKWFRRTPETIGPMAPPAPAKPTQTAIARVRSSGGKTAMINESVAGITTRHRRRSPLARR